MSFKKHGDSIETNLVENSMEKCYILCGTICPKNTHLQFMAFLQEEQFIGSIAEVDFDYRKVYALEDSDTKVIGFLHSHPQKDGDIYFSQTDDRTMRSWCSCLGKDLLCFIGNDDFSIIECFLFSKQGFKGICNIKSTTVFNDLPKIFWGCLPSVNSK